jgi:hypothetical protein
MNRQGKQAQVLLVATGFLADVSEKMLELEFAQHHQLDQLQA